MPFFQLYIKRTSKCTERAKKKKKKKGGKSEKRGRIKHLHRIKKKENVLTFSPFGMFFAHLARLPRYFIR